ncbi:hypothetical protein, partial [Escherichia coli]|uniref:hypothetical protein n=1 Tax=Escherichia coli TaxID=562 RepID=UPI0019534A1B
HVGPVRRLVVEPVLHIHPGLRASEEDLAVHADRYEARCRTGKLRMFTEVAPPPHGRLRNSTQFGFFPVG